MSLTGKTGSDADSSRTLPVAPFTDGVVGKRNPLLFGENIPGNVYRMGGCCRLWLILCILPDVSMTCVWRYSL